MAYPGHHVSSHQNGTHVVGGNMHPHNFISRNISNHQRIHNGHLFQSEKLVAHKRGFTEAQAGKPAVVIPCKVTPTIYNAEVVQRRMRDFHDKVVLSHSTKYRDPRTTFASGAQTYVKFRD